VTFDNLTRDQIDQLHRDQQHAYAALQQAGLTLDITRGKPAPEQLDLSNAMLSLPGEDFRDAAGTDTRNYGGLTGILELRQIFAEILQAPVEQVLAADNASLALMHDNLVFALLHGVPGSDRPWGKEETVRFVCPSPGYDRHFALCEALGKQAVEVPDIAGFVVNRLLFPFLFSAVRLMEETGLEPQAIDTCMQLGAGHPMGPLALIDYVGLDVSKAIGESIGTEIPATIDRLISEGALGKKTGRGLYTYES